jgi:hypothetical protein
MNKNPGTVRHWNWGPVSSDRLPLAVRHKPELRVTREGRIWCGYRFLLPYVLDHWKLRCTGGGMQGTV